MYWHFTFKSKLKLLFWIKIGLSTPRPQNTFRIIPIALQTSILLRYLNGLVESIVICKNGLKSSQTSSIHTLRSQFTDSRHSHNNSVINTLISTTILPHNKSAKATTVYVQEWKVCARVIPDHAKGKIKILKNKVGILDFLDIKKSKSVHLVVIYLNRPRRVVW